MGARAAILPLLATGIIALAQPAAQNPANPCEKCHPNESRAQPATPMAHAAVRATDAEILKDHPLLRVATRGYTYVIRREAEQVTLSVSDGKKSFSAPIRWAFGCGSMGQTYVYEYDGAFYESHVSFYSALNGLDVTIGHRNSGPTQLEEASGRRLQKLEVVRCFGCHTTGALDAFTPGVQCERCHQNAQQHARAFDGQTVPSVTPPKLSRLGVEELSDFCGGCHRTWQEIAANGPHDINNIRFQPYRLATSNCYNSSLGDQRISCVACHDPHSGVEKRAAYYDAKCQACHQAGNAPQAAKPCTVAQHGCVSCHMPKVDFPGGHFQFTDHRIRVVRAGSGYPG
jgi:hypothetical protein